MKKLSTILIAVLSMAAVGLAFAGGPDKMPEPNVAQNQFYVGLHGGVGIPSGDFAPDTGLDVGAQVGYRWQQFRFELAYTYLRNNVPAAFLLGRVTHAHTNIHLFMANAYYDFIVNHWFVPYVGFGIGWLRDNAVFALGGGSTVNGIADNRFAYQAIAGLGFHITQNIMLSARYRFVGWTNNGGDHMHIAEASLDYFI